MKRCLLSLVVVCLVGVRGWGAAQEPSKTQALAHELTELLQKEKRDAMAAKLGDDQFAAVLYFPGVQLLAVQARYAAPALLFEKIILGRYRDAYMDLSSASIPDSKLLIEDMLADGVRPRREGNVPFDLVTRGTGTAFAFDGEWKKRKVREDDYMKNFADTEAAYERILTALLAQARKGS